MKWIALCVVRERPAEENSSEIYSSAGTVLCVNSEGEF